MYSLEICNNRVSVIWISTPPRYSSAIYPLRVSGSAVNAGEKNSASRPTGTSRGFSKRKEEMIGHAVGRRHVGHQSVKSEQSVGVGGGTFGHTRRDIIALNIDRRLSATASRALEIGRKMPESVRAFLPLSLPLSIFRSLSPWPFRRFVCAAIGVSTHTRCAHNRLREAKPL